MNTNFQLAFASIPILGVIGQWIAWQIKVPSILILLVIGLVAGPFTNILNPDLLFGPKLFSLISLSVAIILFDGGLSLKIGELLTIRHTLRNMIIIGALLSWIILTVAAHHILGFDLELAILLGAILLVTGPTVVTPLLQHSNIKKSLASILRWEGTLIDPIGAMLAVLVFKIIFIGQSNLLSSQAVLIVISTVFTGIFFGALSAVALAWILHKKWFPDFLHEAFTFISVLLIYTLSNSLQTESGLFAVTIMGIVLANQQIIKIRHIVSFKENITVLLLSSIFVILGARLTIQDLSAYFNFKTLLFLIIVIFLARPFSVFIATMRSKLGFKEKILLSWMYPRGIVAAAMASHFAIQLSNTGYEFAHQLSPVTFIVIIVTVTLYSLTLKPLAFLLNLVKQTHKGLLIIGAGQWVQHLAEILTQQQVDVLIVDTSRTDIIDAKSKGLNAITGSIASQKIREVVSAGKFDSLLALTPSDELNLLTAMIYENILDPKRVYRLCPTNKNFLHLDQHGQLLFNNSLSYNYLNARLTAGGKITAFNLNKKVNYVSVLADYPKAVPLFLITKQKHVQIYTPFETFHPSANQTVICLV
ncbi:cation:proton antiporter [Thermoproteota archaeon]